MIHHNQTKELTGVHVDGPSPRVVEGGPGGWGRTGLTVMALVASARSVVATALVSAGPAPAATMALSLTLAAISNWMRLSRWGRSWGIVGVENLWGATGVSGPSVISSRTSSSWTLWKVGNDVLHVMMAQR
jgi:hypothetical protein